MLVMKKSSKPDIDCERLPVSVENCSRRSEPAPVVPRGIKANKQILTEDDYLQGIHWETRSTDLLTIHGPTLQILRASLPDAKARKQS